METPVRAILGPVVHQIIAVPGARISSGDFVSHHGRTGWHALSIEDYKVVIGVFVRLIEPLGGGDDIDRVGSAESLGNGTRERLGAAGHEGQYCGGYLQSAGRDADHRVGHVGLRPCHFDLAVGEEPDLKRLGDAPAGGGVERHGHPTDHKTFGLGGDENALRGRGWIQIGEKRRDAREPRGQAAQGTIRRGGIARTQGQVSVGIHVDLPVYRTEKREGKGQRGELTIVVFQGFQSPGGGGGLVVTASAQLKAVAGCGAAGG